MVFTNAPQGRSARGALFFQGASFGCGRGVPTLMPRYLHLIRRWCSKPFGVLLGVATDWTYRWRLGQFFTLGHWLADGWVLGRF